MHVVELERVTVERGSTTAVAGLDLHVAAGEVVALLGPNGAGKTTTLETIEGYLRPTAGTCRVFGLDPATNRAAIAHRWGVMPQQGGLPTGMTVGEAISLFAGLGHDDGATARRLAEEATAVTGLGSLAGRRWRRLSGGEQQRLSLALALCGGTELLLLDEPTAAVDQDGRTRVLDAVKARAAEGSAVLVTTHRFDDVERLADRVVIVGRGRVVASGTLAELTEGHDEITFELAEPLSDDELAVLAQRVGGAPERLASSGRGAARYRLPGSADASAAAGLAAALADLGRVARSVAAGHRSLEELYDAVLGEAGENGEDAS